MTTVPQNIQRTGGAQLLAPVTTAYGYGASDYPQELTNKLTYRLDAVMLDNDDFWSYDYLGVSTVTDVQFQTVSGMTVQPRFGLSRRFESDGKSTAGVYPGFDRFGRVRLHAWVDADFAESTSNNGFSNIPPISMIEHHYDAASTGFHGSTVARRWWREERGSGVKISSTLTTISTAWSVFSAASMTAQLARSTTRRRRRQATC